MRARCFADVLLAASLLTCLQRAAAQPPIVLVSGVSFVDQDVDTYEIGGPLTWSPPSDVTQVTIYKVYIAEDATGWYESQVGADIPEGTNSFAIPGGTGTVLGSKTHVLVYAANTFGKPTAGNAASQAIVDVTEEVTGVSFTDLDLDSGEIGGTLAWTEPADSTGVASQYVVYLASGADGAGRVSFFVAPLGTSSEAVATDTSSGGKAFFVLYVESVLEEQTTPAALGLVDSAASASGVTLPDLDLDGGELGGTIEWTPPASVTLVDTYAVYLAGNGAGAGRVQLPGGDVPVGTDTIGLSANTPATGFTHVVVYTQSSLTEQTTPAAGIVTDEDASASALAFFDLDLDADDLGGSVTWDPPGSVLGVTYYVLYLAYSGLTSKSKIGVDIAVGTNEGTIVVDTTRGSYENLLVYTKSSLHEQSTPTGIAISDVTASVSTVTWVDLDLDGGELGGEIQWTEPGDPQVQSYNVYFAQSAAGAARSQVGASLATGVTSATIPLGTATSGYTDAVVYTKSALAEQTTPEATSLNDAAPLPSSIAFTDLDLDDGDLGGDITWQPPGTDLASVANYGVYLATSSAGAGRVQVGGGAIPVGTNKAIVAPERSLGTFTYVVVYTASSLAEQNTPQPLLIVDADASASTVGFVDLDLDAGQIGGTVTWQPPGDATRVAFYDAYLATSSLGAGRSLLSSTADPTVGASVAAETAKGSYTHAAVYTRSTLVEQTTPASGVLVDSDIVVGGLALVDLDLDGGQLGGTVTWTDPGDTTLITTYAVYFATDSSGGSRFQLGGGALALGTNEIAIVAGTAKSSYTHVVAYSASALASQSTPAAFPVSDAASTASSVAFQDLDLDAGQIGGSLTWSPPTETTHVAEYKTYLASDDVGTGRVSIADVAAGTNQATLGADTVPAFGARLVVYTASSLTEQTTPANVAPGDEAVSVSGVQLTDQDLDSGQLGGTLAWDPPGDTALVTQYFAYLALSSAGASRTPVDGPAIVGYNQVTLPADTARGSWTHTIVYTRSALAEQSTPVTSDVTDLAAQVSTVSFSDQDLDANELGGTVLWDPPGSLTEVFGYRVYLADNAAAAGRSPVGGAVAVGTNAAGMAAGTVAADYVVVFVESTFTEQTTPAAASVVDTGLIATPLVFEDLDLDVGEIGGEMTWATPSSTTEVVEYRVYLERYGVYASTSLLGSAVPVGTNALAVVADTPKASFTHAAVYAKSALEEQTTAAAALAFSDTHRPVGAISFSDADLDVAELGGKVSWFAPYSTDQVDEYVIYLAEDTFGANRASIGAAIAVGTNEADMQTDTALSAFAYIVVYTSNAFAEQSVPQSTSLSDSAVSVSGVAFVDADLDAGEVGGDVTWAAAPTPSALAGYSIYLATSAAGAGRALLNGAVAIGSNTEALAPDRSKGAYTHVAVYTRSDLAEQSTPQAFTLSDSYATVSSVQFTDLDLDAGHVGGEVKWTAPDALLAGSLVNFYDAYLATDAAGSNRASVGSAAALGTNVIALGQDVATASSTRIVIYTRSALVEQTTPAAAVLGDIAAAPVAVAFVDLDLDAQELGGAVTWDPPAAAAQVSQYHVYLAESASGTDRSHIGVAAIGAGQRSLALPADVGLASFTHVAVYSRSTLAEQTTPSAVSIVDVAKTVTSIAFTDNDLDPGELAGDVTWTPPSSATPSVVEFRVYVANDNAGGSRLQLGAGAVNVGTNELAVALDSATSGRTQIAVYCASSLTEQTTPAILSFSDSAALATALTFVDLDLDALELGGDVTWGPEGEPALVSDYTVWLAEGAAGTSRSLVGTLAFGGGGGGTLALDAETAHGSFTHALVYSRSAAGEQTTPAAVALSDVTAEVSDVLFLDEDLDDSQIGGSVKWTSPADETYVTQYVVYASNGAQGQGRLSLGSVSDGTNQLAVAAETDITSETYLVIYARSQLVEQTTPTVRFLYDTVTGPVSGAFDDLDLDGGQIGGDIVWSGGGATALQDYSVYLAESAAGNSRTVLGSALAVSVNTLALAADTALGSYTHALVYAKSSLAEVTTPFALAIADSALSVSSMDFVDADLDASEVGGEVSWTAPTAAGVDSYVAYLAGNVGGSTRTLAGTASLGTNAVNVAADTAVGTSSHIVVYTRSTLAEQTTPVGFALSDSSATASGLSFTDLDLDALELGGQFDWSDPADTALLDGYNAYLAQSTGGAGRSQIGDTTGNYATVLPETRLDSYTHLVVYTRSELQEQTTPSALGIVDGDGSVTSLAFTDEDLDPSQFGGTVVWASPAHEARVTHYAVFFSTSTQGYFRSQIANTIEVGTNEVSVAVGTARASHTYAAVYSKSSLVWQSRPTSVALQDMVSTAADISFSDEDLDDHELGGVVTWSASGDHGLVVGYAVYFAEDLEGASRSQIGGQVGANVFAAAVDVDTPLAQHTHVVVYAVSALEEQTTPRGFKIYQVHAIVSHLEFTDLDLDADEVGGTLEWQEPSAGNVVADYVVYLAVDDAGAGRVSVASPVPFGTNAAGVPAETSFVGVSRLVVYTKSTMFEQTTPRAVLVEDNTKVVSGIALVDLDLDAGEVGGSVTWTPPAYHSVVTHYVVYLAQDSTGTAKSWIGAAGLGVPVGTHNAFVAADTAVGSFTHLLVYVRSSLVEQTTPVGAALVDIDGTVIGLGFTDDDLDSGEVGGVAEWTNAGGDAPTVVTSYVVYVAELASGAARSEVSAEVPPDATQSILPTDIPLGSYTSVAVYARSSLAEQSTPAAVAIVDVESRADSVAFVDDDLDANELGGTVTWSLALTATRVTGFDVFISDGAGGGGRSRVNGPLAASARDLTIPAETPKGVMTHVVVYARSALALQTTPAAASLVDTSATVSSIVFTDEDLDEQQFGGVATWTPPGDVSRVAHYVVYLAQYPGAGAAHSQLGNALPTGTDSVTFSDAPKGLFQYLTVHTASAMAEQTTPAAIAAVDNAASVGGVTFADYDLDLGHLGGSVTWTPPTSVALVSHYVVYLGEDDAGGSRSQADSAITVGTNEGSIAADTAAMSYGWLSVYTASSFVEQTTPASALVVDYAASVAGLSFVDLDLDAGELGGGVSWTGPQDLLSRAMQLSVHLAEDAAGTVRSQLAVVSPGVLASQVPVDLPASSWTHVVVYVHSTLAEQTTPVAVGFSDVAVLAASVAFADADLDGGQIGGALSWASPTQAALVASYSVYLSSDAAGASKSLVGSILVLPGGVGTISTSPDIDFAVYSHVAVYAKSTFAEQTTPSAIAISDLGASVSAVNFGDDDLDANELGGLIDWAPPAETGMLSDYMVYLAQGADGTARNGGVSVDVGTNQVPLPMDTALGSNSHVVVYSRSALDEQTTPAAMTLVDAATAITGLSFADLDLDAGDLGGLVEWTPVDVTRAASFALYLVEDAAGSDPVPAVPAGAHIVEVGTNELNVLVDTPLVPPTSGVYPHYARTHVILYAASALAEQTTAAAVAAISDVARSASALQFTDVDLDLGELAGTLSWTAPPVTTEVTAYDVYLLDGLGAPRSSVGQVLEGTNQILVPVDSAFRSDLAVYTRSSLIEQSTPVMMAVGDSSASVSGVSFSDLDYTSGQLGGDVTWAPPSSDADLVAQYVVYLADDDEGSNRASALIAPIGTDVASIPSGTVMGSRVYLVVYTESTLTEQTTPIAFAIGDLFQGRELMHVGLTADTSSAPLDSAEIESFTYVGCYAAPVDANATHFGANAVVTTVAAANPALCADVCASYDLFGVQQSNCVCARTAFMDTGAFEELLTQQCDAACDAWSTTDFPTLADYFASRPGFCGGPNVGMGATNGAAWSLYEHYDAVMAVGQGAVDRSRGLWWQVVLVQVFSGGGGHSDQSVYSNVSSWQWHIHASALATGRAAFPLHRQVDQPLVGLVMEELSESPRLLGTTPGGDVMAVPVGGAQPPERVLLNTQYPNHTVDDTLVEPGAAPMMALDPARGVLLATQPVGADNSKLYALPLDFADNRPYLHIRFVPSCGLPWCSVNEIRFRYLGQEVDLSGATTFFIKDLSDTSLPYGAIMIDFGSATMVDEFSVSVPYNMTTYGYLTWILEGTNDRIRRCILSGAPATQSMPNGAYIQSDGELRQGRPLFRASSGEVIYWDSHSGSWWVSPTVRNGGYGAIRCAEDVFEPHLLTTVCQAWDGHSWQAHANIRFECLGNEWDLLHQQEKRYPFPADGAAPLRWFQVSRNSVAWSDEGDVAGHVGLLVIDPLDSYLAAALTRGTATSLRTLGRVTNPTCEKTTVVSFDWLDVATSPAVAINCEATTFRRGDWVWPDAAGAFTLWFTCADAGEFSADQWTQRYVEAAADASFGWGSGTLDLGRGGYVVRSQHVRILEIALQPSMPGGAFFDGVMDYFHCPVQATCTTAPSLTVRLIPANGVCGCASEVSLPDPHGFYKACYCVADTPRFSTQSVACDADAHFNALAGTAIGMGPEPARVPELDLILGQSWAFGISDTASTFSGIYRKQLEYAAGGFFGSLTFPSSVLLTNATPAGCGYNPSACDLVGPAICTLGESCSVSLSGTAMQEFNGLKVIRNTYSCVSPLAHPELAVFESLVNPKTTSRREAAEKVGYRSYIVWDLGTPTRGALGPVTLAEPGPGIYTLCWGYNPDANLTTPEESYYVDAGAFTVLGPFVMDFECSLHFPCAIQISGIGLASTNKVLLIESSHGRCGTSGVALPDSGWSGIQNPIAVQLDARYNSYVVGTASGKSGATHRLCWAHDPPETEFDGSPITDYSSHFRVEIDPDFVWMRFTAVVDCVVGRVCMITVYGVGMGSTSGVLLVTMNSACGSAAATAISAPGLTNPQQVIDPGVTSSTVGVYLMTTSAGVSVPPYFRICWGPNPADASAVNYPLEVLFPLGYPQAVFFSARVGAIGLAKLESDRLGRHRALVLYADTTKVQAPTSAWSALDARLDYDCCRNAGLASASVLDVVDNVVRPSAGHVFHEHPVAEFSSAVLSVREPLVQGLQCGEACGDEFTSLPTDYVVASGFLDVINPERATGTTMLLKAEPRGPPWARTWAAQRAPLHDASPLVYEATRCTTSDPLATCTRVSSQSARSLRVVALSPTRLLATFAEGDARQGMAVVIKVVHHLPDSWEFQTGLPVLFNAGETSHCDVVRLSASKALVAFYDEGTQLVQALALEVASPDTDVVTVGPAATLGEVNMSAKEDGGNATEENSTQGTHKRLSVGAVGTAQVLVAFGSTDAPGELALVSVSDTVATKSVSTQFRSTNMDDISVVPLGTVTSKALVVYRDESEGGIVKAQEVDIYGDFNGMSYALEPGSLSTVTASRTEGVTAIALDASTVLVAYRDMDGMERACVRVIKANFNVG